MSFLFICVCMCVCIALWWWCSSSNLANLQSLRCYICALPLRYAYTLTHTHININLMYLNTNIYIHTRTHTHIHGGMHYLPFYSPLTTTWGMCVYFYVMYVCVCMYASFNSLQPKHKNKTNKIITTKKTNATSKTHKQKHTYT